MFYEHGIQAFISKPIDILELDAVVRKWLRDIVKEGMVKSDEADTDSMADAALEKINIPGVNTEKGLSLYGGEMDIYLPLLRSYVSNTPGILGKLRNVSEQTLPEYVISVHGLKGTSAGIGAEALREAALKLETMSRAGDWAGVLSYNDRLIKDAETIVTNVRAWLENYDSRNAKPRLKTPDRDILAKLQQSCETYDMTGIDWAMFELESSVYEEGGDLIAWLREKIDVSEFGEAAERLRSYAAV
jgi:HPt (histidine-containing phosphotransfer) domain-containing protein